MTDYFYVALTGVAIGATAMFFGTTEPLRGKVVATMGIIGGCLFALGLVLGVAEIVA